MVTNGTHASVTLFYPPLSFHRVCLPSSLASHEGTRVLPSCCSLPHPRISLHASFSSALAMSDAAAANCSLIFSLSDSTARSSSKPLSHGPGPMGSIFQLSIVLTCVEP